MKAKAKLLIENNGKLLLLQPHAKQKMTLIGGTVDTHESPIDTAVREGREEVGIAIEKAELNDYYFCWGHEKSKPILFYCFLLRNKDLVFELKEPNKFQYADWIDIDEGLAKLKGVERKAASHLVQMYIRTNTDFYNYRNVI